MIAQHGQALELTALVQTRTTNEDLRLLAQRIEISQQDEIVLMQTWLSRRGLPVPDPLDHAGHEDMPGMLTAQQITQLDDAREATFERLFLEFMIYHHQGAV